MMLSVADRAVMFLERLRDALHRTSPRQLAVTLVTGFFVLLYSVVAVFGIPRFVSQLIPVPALWSCGRLTWSPRVWKLADGLAASEQSSPRSVLPLASEIAAQQSCVNTLAEQLGVTVSEAEMDEVIVDQAERAFYQEQAGWSASDYRDLVVKPLVLMQKVDVAVRLDVSQQPAASQRVAGVIEKLDRGIPFADVAQNYSESPSARSAGNFGYLSPGDINPVFAPTFTLQVGQHSPAISTERYFWVTEVLEVVVDDQGVPSAWVRGIAVRKDGVASVVDELLMKNSALSLMR